MITKGSQDNVMLVGMQRADLGIAVADSLEQGYTGSAPEKYPKPLSHLRALGALFPNYVHLFATQASGIKTLEDFKGKRISAGSKGSGGHLNFENIMKAAGLKYSDFAKTEFVNYSQTIELMQNRRVDATSMTSGLGVASVRQISSSIPIRFIPMSPEFVKSMNNTSYVSSKLPANSYKGQTDPMDTFTVWAIVFTHSRLSDEAAYNIVKAIYEHPDIMAAAHEANKDVSLNNALTGIPCPLHPGAEKYYREKGVLK
jgi:TRAP transporter TAXI family solute receptor